MSHPARSLAAPLLLVTALACASTPRADPAVDPLAEEQAIRELDRRWVDAIAARNLDALMTVYAQDAIFSVANAPAASGTAQVRTGWQELLGLPDLSLTFAPTRIVVARSGDLASDVGTYRLSFRGPDGRVQDEGVYSVVWRKVGGDWKVASDFVITTSPPAPPQAVSAAPGDAVDAASQAAASMQWVPLRTPGFASGAEMAVIHGDPRGTGDYTIRIRFPDGYEIPPHWHPGAEHLTVLQGTFMLGMGERFDQSALKSYAPGDFLYAPAKMPHYGRTRGQTIVQLHGMGPFETKLVTPAS
jgi:ketosteroid isomerase-like protein/quercetin dioxygenase-like cupin family protein